MQQLSVLDLTLAHEEGLAQLLARPEGADDARRITRAAGDFFLESMASFEMLHRGAGAARESIAQHLRKAQLSRQLSSFLADASLAVSPESLGEVLQLAVDLGREMIAAECCLGTVSAGVSPRVADAISYTGPDSGWRWVRWLRLERVHELLDDRSGSFRLSGEPAVDLLCGAAGRRVPEISGWVAASLTALDGTRIGALQAFSRPPGRFSADDGAALSQLAQMVSGAAERMRLYH